MPRSTDTARAVALSLALLLVSAAAAKAGPVPAPPAAQAFQLGALKLFALRDAGFAAPNDGQTFGVDVGPKAVSTALRGASAPTDHITLAVDALLVEAPGRVMLFDTGLGPAAGGLLMASLAQARVAPDAVTDVMITHTHGDHVGGLATAAGGLAFPNATIRMSAREWAWMRSQAGTADLVRIVAPKVVTFEPGAPVAPGVTPVAVDGHTPGHVGYEIVSGAAKLFDIGDTAHSSIVSLAHPEWIMGFDSDAAVGKASRRATLSRLAQTHERVFAPHFPFPGVGRIVVDGAGFAWRPEAN